MVVTKIKQNKILKVYDFNSHSSNWLLNYKLVKTPGEADIIIFPGGADINPRLYGQKKGCYTHFYPSRDQEECEVFDKYEGKKAMVGICRGHQLLSCMIGGHLIQDMEHPSVHGMIDYMGNRLLVNSLHHQQVCLEKLKPSQYILLGWSEKNSPFHLDENDKDCGYTPLYKEPEALYLPTINAFTIQGHPEWMYGIQYRETVEWCRTQVNKFLVV